MIDSFSNRWIAEGIMFELRTGKVEGGMLDKGTSGDKKILRFNYAYIFSHVIIKRRKGEGDAAPETGVLYSKCTSCGLRHYPSSIGIALFGLLPLALDFVSDWVLT